MTLLEELEKLGADTKDGISRLMNNEEVYIRIVKKLPGSIKAQEVLSFIDSGDIQSAITSAHTIKGVTGNLAITPVYKAYTEIVNLLREDRVSEARQLYLDTIPVQNEFIAVIEKY